MNTAPSSQASDPEEWLVGSDGEMVTRVRSMDWARTPLGPREAWPQNLRTLVVLCLASKVPVVIFWGPERVQIYNDGYRLILGAKHPQALGQSASECWAEIWPIICPMMVRVFETREAVWGESSQFSVERSGYLEEAYFTFSNTPVLAEDGQVGGIFETVAEVTAEVLSQRRFAVLRDLSRAAGGESVDAACATAAATLVRHPRDVPFALLYLLDPPNRVCMLRGHAGIEPGLAASPRTLTLGPQDPWGLNEALEARAPVVLRDLGERLGPLPGGPWPESAETAVILPIEHPGTAAPFGFFVAGVNPRRALDEDYLAFFQLICQHLSRSLSTVHAYETERRRAEALAAIDRAKTAFFSNVSHEFRTPLTLMLGPLDETLRDRSRRLTETDWNRLDTARRNALRLLKLVNSLLAFSRIEAGRTQATYTATDLATFTREIASMFSSAFDSAGLEFTTDCPPLPEPVYVDPDLWEKIVLNLVSNAFKFTFEGRVQVRLRWQEGSAVLTVSDTGTGVPPEHLPHLFERFHRVPNARSRTFEGSGIGLALVHELVKLHGGTIRVDSVLDQGTTLTITIPGGTKHLPADRIAAQPKPSPTSLEAQAFVDEALQWLPEQLAPSAAVEAPADRASAVATAPAVHRARILVVDDNADMRRYLHTLLAPRWRVEVATDGLQALDAVQRELPDLVLTDVMMPRLNGFGLLRALRADPRTHALPVIMLSARAGEEARVEGLEAGADDYLAKPFGARELLARVSTHLDIARLREQAVELAQHDPLTGLPNRALSLEFTEGLLAGARRSRSHAALLYIDMDHFKPINDTYGHEVGDKVLKEVARRLKACVRGEDTAGRLGGDEFIAVLTNLHDTGDAVHAAQHLMGSLGQAYLVNGLELHISPSIGIALFPSDGEDVDTLLKNADAAMYSAKESGRNNFRFYTPELNASAERAQWIENRLRGALERGEFALHYQPIVDISMGTVVGAEVLVRWPATGIGPHEFIPVAEQCGLIEPLGAWILDEACRQLRQWRDRGLPALTLSINFSSVQFRQRTLQEVIARAANDHAIDPGDLQLELTEAAVLGNMKEAISIMGAMKQSGAKIALDGFGKGYSNLGSLGQMPLDTLKVDQTIVRNGASDPASRAVIDAIVALGKTLKLQVVAEGVESAESLMRLHDQDCTRMQGYYLCPPVAADAFEDWCHRWQQPA